MQDFLEEKLDLSVLNDSQRDLLVPLISDQLRRPGITTAELLRFIFLTPELLPFRQMSNTTLAKFLRCSDVNVSRVLRALNAAQHPAVAVATGRPRVLNGESEQAITDWLRERAERMDWPTLSSFKERVFFYLERDAPHFAPGRQFFYDLLARLTEGEFNVRSASGLDPQRYEVTPETIHEHFEVLHSLEIESIDPRLIINIDETGFGQSLSGRSKPQKVIVPVSFTGSPVYRAGEEKRYVSCISATTLAGDLLRPGLICNRKQEADDASKCSFFNACARYHSATAFISTDIFLHYMRTVVLDYVLRQRETLGHESRCLIIFDGHKGHLSPLMNALCAEEQICLVVLPPHSSHLLQPLDQLIFRRMKQEFGQLGVIRSLTKVSSTLERVWGAYQASNVTSVIWRSWEHVGIVPIVEEGVCRSCTLNEDIVTNTPTLQHDFTVNERSRGRPVNTGVFGFLNEDEFLLLEAGQCPFCCQPLAEVTRNRLAPENRCTSRSNHFDDQ